MTSDPDLNTEFETIISLAVVASLVAYFYTAIAEIVVSRREGKNSKKHILISIIAILAAIYSFWAICGSGVTMIAYELLLLLASLPFYAWMCYQKDKQRKQTLC
jgi:amino acid transporter